MSVSGFFLSLDTQTTTSMIAIALLIQAIVIGSQSIVVRAYKGIRTVAWANLTNALGMMLVGFRGLLSPWVTIIIANYLILFGTVLHYMGICRFLSSSYNRTVIVFSSLPVLALFPYYTFIKDDLVLRIVIISLCTATLIGAGSLKLLQLHKSAYRQSAFSLSVITGVYAIVLLVRAVGVTLYPPEDVFTQNFIMVFHGLVLFIASLLWTSGFSFMVGQRLQVDLDELSTVDSLTRLTNRRGMTRLLEAEFARNTRSHSGFAVLLVDVDKFKAINDKFGHYIGDVVLQQIAHTMKGFVREQDFVSRWGGEEFLILLPATGLNEATHVGERLCRKIEQETFKIENKAMPLTISIGVASSDGCVSLHEIYKNADQALYKAKLSRNAVAVQDFVRNGQEAYLSV
ncbi:MAG: GGDEF domain-containing protein [Anaerolineales bacterium]